MFAYRCSRSPHAPRLARPEQSLACVAGADATPPPTLKLDGDEDACGAPAFLMSITPVMNANTSYSSVVNARRGSCRPEMLFFLRHTLDLQSPPVHYAGARLHVYRARRRGKGGAQRKVLKSVAPNAGPFLRRRVDIVPRRSSSPWTRRGRDQISSQRRTSAVDSTVYACRRASRFAASPVHRSPAYALTVWLESWRAR